MIEGGAAPEDGLEELAVFAIPAPAPEELLEGAPQAGEEPAGDGTLSAEDVEITTAAVVGNGGRADDPHPRPIAVQDVGDEERTIWDCTLVLMVLCIIAMLDVDGRVAAELRPKVLERLD